MIPPPATQKPSGRASSAATVRLGEALEFEWPVPDRTVAVQGRTLAFEIAVVGGLHGLLALWLLWLIRTLFTALPDSLAGLFSDEFTFVFSWAVLAVSVMLLYVVAGLAWCSYLLLRGDPVGRGLAAVICGMLTLLLFSDDVPTALVLIWLVSTAGVVVLFLSPWARRTFKEGERRHDRPASVVLAQTLALSYLSLVGLVALLLLPGLRFAGFLGASFVFLVLLYATAAPLGLVGVRRLGAGPDRLARLFVTASVGATLLAVIIGMRDASTVGITLAVLAGTLAPLWLSPRAREWFGDGPLTQPGPSNAPPQ